MKAIVRHILVTSKEICQELKNDIANGSSFSEIAKDYSECPSGSEGGDLGEVSPGEMVKDFDKIVFTGELNKVIGPVKTQFGYHLIEILNRTKY